YRETSREFYSQNNHVVERWRWQAAHNQRTCAMCLAMDGQEFQNKISLDTHPNCRCTLVPVTKTWKELGFDFPVQETSNRAEELGPDWFSKQDDKVKQK